MNKCAYKKGFFMQLQVQDLIDYQPVSEFL